MPLAPANEGELPPNPRQHLAPVRSARILYAITASSLSIPAATARQSDSGNL